MRKLLIALGALILAGGAWAASTPNSFISPQAINRGILQFTSASSAGTYSTLYTAQANGSRCYALWASASDVTAHTITLQLVNGANKYGGEIISTGTNLPGFANGVPSLNLLSPSNWAGLPVDQYGNPFIQLVSPDSLQATFATAITVGTFINLVASCSDY